jgi:hypothetical protein
MEDESSFHHGEYVKSITPDVLAVINRVRFFELLDDRFCPLCPLGDVVESPKCAHSFDLTEGILAGLENDPEDIQDVLDVLRSLGACCDCEVLFNVAEESRMRARYWRNRNA